MHDEGLRRPHFRQLAMKCYENVIFRSFVNLSEERIVGSLPVLSEVAFRLRQQKKSKKDKVLQDCLLQSVRLSVLRTTHPLYLF